MKTFIFALVFGVLYIISLCIFIHYDTNDNNPNTLRSNVVFALLWLAMAVTGISSCCFLMKFLIGLKDIALVF